MDNPEYINQLAEKWVNGTITDEEKAFFNAWYDSFDFSELKMEVSEGFEENVFKEKIRTEIKNKIPEFDKTQKGYPLWSRIAIAAAVAAMICSAGLVYFFNHSAGPVQTIAFKNDIGPGQNAGTLTLSDGRKIRLSDALNGKLAKDAGINITKTSDGQVVYEISKKGGELKYNTLSTARGQTYILTLSDNSKVWLNAASSLKYPSNFASLKERTVELTGEAYFEVSKDKEHPFIVKSAGQRVRVLGTHFNINSYGDEPATKTTLLEGSVQVSSLSGNKEHQVLKPGQQSVLSQKSLTIRPANEQEAISWKNGRIFFEDESLESIMRKVSRWYDVQVILKGNVKAVTFQGALSRTKKISSILAYFERAGNLKCTVDGRTITIESK